MYRNRYLQSHKMYVNIFQNYVFKNPFFFRFTGRTGLGSREVLKRTGRSMSGKSAVMLDNNTKQICLFTIICDMESNSMVLDSLGSSDSRGSYELLILLVLKNLEAL